MPALAQHAGQVPLLPNTLYTTAPLSSLLASPSLSSTISPDPTATSSPPLPSISVTLAAEPDLTSIILQTSILETHPPASTSNDQPTRQYGDEAPGLDTCTNISMFGGRVIVPRTIVSAVFSIIALSSVHRYYGGNASKPYKTTEESSWIASSNSWLGRQSCKWLGVCGLTHLNKAGWIIGQTAGQTLSEPGLDSTSPADELDFSSFWQSGTSDPRTWTNHERQLRHIPQYVLDHAPLIHLYSQEQFWPCDIAEHLIHTTPYLNYTPLQAEADHPTLDNLDGLNEWGRFTYLHSDDNVEDRPKWLGGKRNIPSSPDNSLESTPGWDSRVDGPLPSLHDGSISDWYDAGLGDILENGGSRSNPLAGSKVAPVDGTSGEEMINQRLLGKRLRHSQLRLQNSTAGGRSDAPAVLLTVDKGNGVLDAFWFFFYSYNLGNEVFNIRFGNHVGDWEHTVIRFLNGEPKAVFFSEHNFGEAVAFEAVEKIGQRPVGYSGRGTHAMYGTPGDHPYVLPLGLLHDVTDRGPLWDPLQNVHSFTYDYLNRTLRASDLTPKAPVHWFYFRGHWGDKLYPLHDPRQYRFAGQYHYVNGPLGPMFKNLGRQRICQGNGPCVIKDTLG